ncbi:stage II sporulation protein R [Chengkuizengella axinellae]|uniref:Stage II sporulation protein R n=1 Tax=Chengkuizengella axinellae TaxID=3064388 RepID=A0ABT9J5C0_9BACL|nr:stage II sporulation protein R [Chengkuizengella sp. 2205SS18-9]MDP5276811.1 stage II sporulation protein R [Chengkuizengella sp. 2205SS18-9]
MLKPSKWKSYFYLSFVLILLLMNWEYQQAHATLIENTIPEESIRLRILANSDSPRDQWIKGEIRNEIVKYMNDWVAQPDQITDAREMVSSHMNQLEALVGKVLKDHGFDESYTVELGSFEFPTKMYGNKVYPAGLYEALRVVVGEGNGQNWWCVLFPPLCFVDATTGEAIAQEEIQEDIKNKQDGELVTDQELAEKPEARFFLWDLIVSITTSIKGAFA